MDNWYDEGEGSESMKRKIAKSRAKEKPLIQKYTELKTEIAQQAEQIAHHKEKATEFLNERNKVMAENLSLNTEIRQLKHDLSILLKKGE